MSKLYTLLLIIFSGFLFSCVVVSQKPQELLPLDPAVKQGILPDGMRYYLRQNSKPLKRAAMYLAVRTGSLHETEAQSGLAHFVEHMAFNGSKRFPGNALVQYLQSLGIRFGPEVNAHTGFTETVYTIEVPTDKPEFLVQGLTILDDWAHGLTLDPQAIENERGIILEEWRRGQGAEEIKREAFLALLFEGSPYAQRRPIGKPEVFMKAPPEELIKFYRDHYRPENMAIIVVGDFDSSLVEELIQKHISLQVATAAPPKAVQTPAMPAPLSGRKAIQVLENKELSGTSMDVVFRLGYGMVPGTSKHYERSIMINLFNRILGRRMAEHGVKTDSPHARIQAYLSMVDTNYEVLFFNARAREGQQEQSMRDLLLQIETLRRYGMETAELADSKKALRNELETLLAEKDDQESASLAEELGDHFLEGYGAPGIAWEAQEIDRLLPTITTARLTAFLDTAFTTNDMSVLVAGAAFPNAPLPDEAQIAAMIAEAGEQSIVRQSTVAIAVELLPAKPAAGAIVSELVDAGLGLVTWKLSNGITVNFKKTSNKKGMVAFYAASLNGSSSLPDSDFLSADHADTMAAFSGLGPFDFNGLKQFLADKSIALDFSVGTHSAIFEGEAAIGDFETLMTILHVWFTRPAITEDGYKRFLETTRQSLIERDKKPEARYAALIRDTMYQAHLRYRSLQLADMSIFNRQTAQEFLERLLEPSGFTFSFAGDIDPAILKQQVELWLGSLPSKQTPLPFMPATLPLITGKDVRLALGSAPKATVFLLWHNDFPWNYEQSVKMRLLGEIVEIRLQKEIREKRGSSYDIGASVSPGLFPQKTSDVFVQFGCDPKAVDELSQAVKTIMLEFVQQEVSSEELETAKNILVKAREKDLQDDATLAAFLTSLAVLQKEPFSRLKAFESIVRAVSAKDIQAMAGQLFAKAVSRVYLVPAL